MVLPLVFSYSATILRKEASSSRTKPWTQYTVAVLPAALAMNGRPSVPAAASPADPRRTERLLSSLMANPALICSLAGELRTLVGDPLLAPIRPTVPKCADWRLNATCGHDGTPGSCLSLGKRFRHTAMVM